METGRSLSLLVVATVLAAMSILLYRGNLDSIVSDYKWALNDCGDPGVWAWAVIGGLLIVSFILIRGAWKLADPATVTPMVTIVVGVFGGIATLVAIVGAIDAAKNLC
jgi:amino acid transporter